MASAKDILVKPIASKDANKLVKKIHYSGKVVQNSQLHFGVFLNGKCEGVMSFGPSMDKRKTLGLVKNTRWNDFLELNRMAFSDKLPRNSESRAISIAIRLIKKHYPHIQWIISFSDASSCGDGTIYRASGFVLTQINENKTILEFPDGTRVARMTITKAEDFTGRKKYADIIGIKNIEPGSSLKPFLDAGAKPVEGYQLRYIYFINPKAKDRLTVPIIPFSKIDEVGAGMYKGENISLEERRVKHSDDA